MNARRLFQRDASHPNLSVPGGAAVLLQSGQLCTLRGAAGWRVCVESGALWLTEAGDQADHCLTSAEPYVINGRGLVVVECLGSLPARFRVEPSAQRERADHQGQRQQHDLFGMVRGSNQAGAVVAALARRWLLC